MLGGKWRRRRKCARSADSRGDITFREDFNEHPVSATIVASEVREADKTEGEENAALKPVGTAACWTVNACEVPMMAAAMASL